MTPLEDLLETTLTRAASTVGPASALAERSIRRAGGIRRRRRAAAVGATAAVAAAVVAIVSLGGVTYQASQPPIHSPNVPSTPSSSTPSAGAPVPVGDLLDRLQVIWADTLTIHDGTRALLLHPLPKGATQIQFVLPVAGGGYAVELETSQRTAVTALVDTTGTVQSLGTEGVSQLSQGYARVVTSPDGTIIAYSRLLGKRSEIRLIDPTGKLIQSKVLNGSYQPKAVDTKQVWLDPVGHEVPPLPPLIWDRTTNKVTSISLGSETYLLSVDLAHGRAVLGTSACGLELVDASDPEHVVAKRCQSTPMTLMAFSPDGNTFVARAEVVPDDGVDLELLSATDLSPQHTSLLQTGSLMAGWSAKGTLVMLNGATKAADLDVKTGKATYYTTQAQGGDLPRLAPVS